MTRFWMRWLEAWCIAVILFGAGLAVSSVEGWGAAAEGLLRILGGGRPVQLDPPLRFAVGLMGVVTLGWGLTLFVAIRAADALGAAGVGVWRGLTGAVVVWFVIDSLVSAYTGFAWNAASNAVFLAAYLLPVLAAGALRRPGQAGPTRKTQNLAPSGSRA